MQETDLNIFYIVIYLELVFKYFGVDIYLGEYFLVNDVDTFLLIRINYRI